MSIKQQMQSKAAAMVEAMAERARTPQDIEAIRQRVLAQVQAGELQPYVGIPLIQDLSKRLAETKASMAQMVAGMGTPPAQGGAPIAQQVLVEAQQGAGVQALPSNLPQSYAPGGLVAFAGGGDVERYDEGGTTPFGRWWGGVKQSFSDVNEEARLRSLLQQRFGRNASMIPGLFVEQSDAEREAAQQAMGLLYKLNLPQLRTLEAQGTAAIPDLLQQLNPTPATPAVAPTATPAATNTGPAPANTPPVAPTATPIRVGAPGFKLPSLTDAPALTDLGGIVSEGRTYANNASIGATAARKKELEDIDAPIEKARQERLDKRQAGAEKDSAIGRALNLMNLGFGIAGSKERTLAGALGNEGRQGIAELIRGEAANRAAMEKLEDARDNLEQQKAASRKGNLTAADAAGERAANDVRQYTALNVQAAGMGNSQALQRWQGENSNKLGIAGLGLQARGQDVQAAGINAQLQLGQQRNALLEKHYANEAERNKGLLAAAESKAFATWQSSPLFRQAQEQAKKMPPLDAQRFLQQEWLKYRANALPSLMPQGAGTSLPPGVRNVDDL